MSVPVDPAGRFSVWRMRPTGRPCSSVTTPRHVEDELVLVLLRRDRNRGAGDRERQRHVVAVGRHAVVARIHEDRQIGGRHGGEELLLELRLAIGARGVLEVAVGEVPAARLDLGARTLDAHADGAEAAVFVQIRGAVAEQVVGGHVALHALEGGREVVGVQERASAGVGGERSQRVLRCREPRELLRDAAAGEERRAAAARLRRVAAGDDGLQAARVDRIDGDVRADRRVDGRPQLDLVVFAAALHAGAEIEDRLLLLDRRQRFGERLQRAQADVVVEHVHVGRVLRRRVVRGRLLVGRDGAGGRRRRGGAFLVAQRREGGRHLRLVRAEIGQHVEARADRRDRHHVGRRHRLFDVGRRRIHRALDVFGLHRGDVEQQDDQPAPGELLRRHRLGRRGRLRRRCGRGGGGRTLAFHVLREPRLGPREQFRRFHPPRVIGNFLEAEASNVLRLAVLEDLEVLGRQAAHHRTGRVADDDVDGDELHVGAEHRTGLGRRLLFGRGERGREDRRQDRQEKGSRH